MQKTLKPAPGEVLETTGMLRWLRLTARKTATVKKPAGKSGNPAADAAADALTHLLKDARKLA